MRCFAVAGAGLQRKCFTALMTYARVARNACIAERPVETPPGRACEGFALPVLGVAGLLADQDDLGV